MNHSFDEHRIYGRLHESPYGDNPQESVHEVETNYSNNANPSNVGTTTTLRDACTVCRTKYLLRIVAAVFALSLILVVFGLLPYLAIHSASHARYNQTLYYVAGVFALITVPVSVQGIVKHLVNWYMPQVQKVSIRSKCMYFSRVFSMLPKENASIANNKLCKMICLEKGNF